MNDLESRLREHYSRARLPDARIEQILAAAPARVTPPRVWYARLGSVAAALVVGLAGLHLQLVERDITARVLAEFAMNHSKQLDIEIASGDVAVVAAALDRLDIPLRPPGYWPARYAPPRRALLLDPGRARRTIQAARPRDGRPPHPVRHSPDV